MVPTGTTNLYCVPLPDTIPANCDPDITMLFAVTVPVNVGDADITTFPVPVIAFDTNTSLPLVNTAWFPVRPVTVNPVSVGLSPVCNPVSTSVSTPLILILFVNFS